MFEEYLRHLNEDNRQIVSEFYGRGGSPGNPYRNLNVNAYDHLAAKRFPGDKLYADVVRAQTQDYLQRFAPIEDQLAASITPTGTTYLDQDLLNTRRAFASGSANVLGQMSRQNERFGITNAQPSGFENQAVGAMVGGINDTYLRDRDRRQALLTGGLGAIAQNARQVRS